MIHFDYFLQTLICLITHMLLKSIFTSLYSKLFIAQTIFDIHNLNTFDKFKTHMRISQFSHSDMHGSLQPHGLQHAQLPCPSPTPRVYTDSCPLSWWCPPTISSSIVPFSCWLQSFPASGSFLLSHFFVSGGQSIGVSALASVLPKNIQDWSPLGCTGWIAL